MNLTKFQKAVGKCPRCAKIPTWFNNVPLLAYCYGTEEKEHPEMSCIVPPPHNPYIKKTAKLTKAQSGWKTAAAMQKILA